LDADLSQVMLVTTAPVSFKYDIANVSEFA
jgi:hypothetical protein